MNNLPNAVVMVRPAAFGFNPETAEPHWFNKDISEFSRGEVSRRARIEFDLMVDRLRQASVDVVVFDDSTEPVTPNAVFVNNWISFHDDGSVVLYPLYAPNRRPERRLDIIDALKAKRFSISRTIDLTHHEGAGRFLEGTGSIVFDHAHRRAYANVSLRTNPEVLTELCDLLNFEAVTFHATDETGNEIRHTDVMLSVGNRFAVICQDSISNEAERRAVTSGLQETGRQIISIDHSQRANFAGNVLEIGTTGGDSVLAMSTAALHALRPDQRSAIEKHAPIVEAPLSVIEGIEGSSARSMMAGVHLPSL
jgi:hypothetical protein